MLELIKFETEKDFFKFYGEFELEGIEFSEYKEEKLSGFDSEKGFVDVTFYVERESDNKKFRGEFTRGGQGDKWTDDLILEEIPKRKEKQESTWEELEMEAMNLFGDNFDNEKFKDWLFINFKTPKRKNARNSS